MPRRDGSDRGGAYVYADAWVKPNSVTTTSDFTSVFKKKNAHGGIHDSNPEQVV